MKPRILSTARLSIPLATALAALISLPSVHAQNGTWNANAAGDWTNTANWTGGIIADGAGNTATLGNFITANRTITLAADRTIGNITAVDTSHNYTISGANTLTLDVASGAPIIDVIVGRSLTITSVIAGNDGLQKNSTGALITSGANTYTGTSTITNGRLTFGTTSSLYQAVEADWTPANINVNSGGTFGFNVGGAGEFTDANVTTLLANFAASSGPTNGMNAGSNFGFDTTNASGTTFTLTGVIADSTGAGGGTRGLVKSGAGTLVLTNTNTYTGATTVNSGTLRLATPVPFVTAGNLTIAGSSTTLVSDRDTPGPGVTHSFGLATMLNGGNNFTAGPNVTSGTAAIQVAGVTNNNGSVASPNLNPTTANLIVTGGVTMGQTNAGTGNLLLSGTGSVNSIGGAIVNGTRTTANVVKSGTSTWTLSGENTHNGATSVTGGTLVLDNPLALQNSSLDTTASMVGTATEGFSPTVATLTFGGLTGDKDLASVFITSGYSGVTALTLNPGTGVSRTYSGIIADGASGMSLTKTGAGTQVLSGPNSYTGGTTVTAGILQPTLAPALAFYTTPGEVTFSGGTIAVVLDETAVAGWSKAQVDSLLAAATKNSGSLGIDTATGSVSFAPTSLNNGIGLTKLGANTLTLTSANLFTGNTTITATTGGTLRLENTGAVQNSALVSINNRILEVATNTGFSSITPLSINGGTIVSDRATAGAGLTHAFGNLAVSHATQNFTAGTNVTSGTAAIQVASMTCASGSTLGVGAVLNPIGVNLIITGNATGANTGTSSFTLGGTSLGNTIGGAVENGTRTTQNVSKINTGTWTLNGVNTYTGNTTVSDGTLTLSNAASPSNANTGNNASTVTISANGTSFLNLTYAGTDAVAKLFIGAEEKPPGVYGTDAIAVPGVIGIPQITGSGTLTVGAGFSSWITGTFAGGATVPPSQQGENDDPDNDGISNLVEFAIAGQDPTVLNPTIGTFDGTTLNFEKRQPLAASLTYAIQESTDLGISDDWDEVTGASYVNDGSSISYTLTPGTPVRNFLRLQVISN